MTSDWLSFASKLKTDTMLNFLKDRILLFVLVIAGDWISLSAFIKADEIRHDAITIAIAVSLLPSLVISLLVKFFFHPKISKKNFVIGSVIITAALWLAFLFLYLNFSKLNNKYGKVIYPLDTPAGHSKDSIIVGGCSY